MSNIVNKIKDAVTSGKQDSDTANQPAQREQSFSIQPHPAKSNNPAELHRDDAQPQWRGGLTSERPELQVHSARGPHVPSQEIRDNLGQPLSREELRERAAELNQ